MTGRGSLYSSISKEGVLDDILQHLREEEIADSEFVWIELLVNNTSFPIDRDMLLNRKDFIGDIVNITDSLHQNEKPFKLIKKSIEPLFSSAQGRKFLESIDEEELIDLLQKAENMLLDYIFVEEHENRIYSD
ncbi:MAG: hypothetical protein E4G94_08105 [ANME-2 cluster archaeon]|nr:MAG: hypothetical protein E4G94_08105 [ANME-2 cluster archaeon]